MKPAPHPVPSEPSRSPFQAEPNPPPEPGIIKRNGVALDLETGILNHRGQQVKINRRDGIALVEGLLRVMPAILPTDRIVAKVFGAPGMDNDIRLRMLIEDIVPVLRYYGANATSALITDRHFMPRRSRHERI